MMFITRLFRDILSIGNSFKKAIEYNDKNNQNDVKDSKANVFIGFVRPFLE
jgi:hypothetical protein